MHSCILAMHCLKSDALIFSNDFLYEVSIVLSYQDHERAFFDSADWALGKVFVILSYPSLGSIQAISIQESRLMRDFSRLYIMFWFNAIGYNSKEDL
jgi:uncharacterized membrane protein SirB2